MALAMQVRSVAFSFTPLFSSSLLRRALLLDDGGMLARYHLGQVVGGLEFIATLLRLSKALFIFFQDFERFDLNLAH